MTGFERGVGVRFPTWASRALAVAGALVVRPLRTVGLARPMHELRPGESPVDAPPAPPSTVHVPTRRAGRLHCRAAAWGLCAAILGVQLALAGAASAANQIYWTNFGGSGAISQANLDGTGEGHD